MEFREFAGLINARFNQITGQGEEVFHIDATRDDLWAAYLASFPPGTNPVFRQRTEHDCATCRQFIKGAGGIVVLDGGGNYQTVWDIVAEGTYGVVAAKMAEFVRCGSIDRVYRAREQAYGAASNVEQVVGAPSITWHHLHCRLPSRLVVQDVGAEQGKFAAVKQVLARGLEELRLADLETIEDLIVSNSLYRGEEHLSAVRDFAGLKRAYDTLPRAQRANFVWSSIHARGARFRNTAIGTLAQDLAEGMGVEQAVGRFESKVAPHNYRRSSAPITTGMVAKAVETLKELGLEDAVHRRFAVIGDVHPSDVLFVDRSVRPLMKDGLVDLLHEEVKRTAPSAKGAVDVTAEQFFAEILPGASTVSVRVERDHLGNFVSLTAPKNGSTGRLFQWDNDFAWVYDGNVTDSIRERVKAAGGNVDAKLRVSLSWFNYDDLDIHCEGPDGHVYFGARMGILDVDMNAGHGQTRTPVENLAWKSPRDGHYRVYVNQFNQRERVDTGFEVEYAHGNDVRHLRYDRVLRHGESVAVCTFEVQQGVVHNLRFESHMIGGASSTEKWGVTTGQLVPVDTIMLSPNHWGPEGHRRGNRHHIFVLRGCVNPGPARGFFNEYLRAELHDHRKVFEVLAGKLQVEPSPAQLSGVGFSSTRHDRVTLVVQKDGATRTYNVQF